MTTDTIRTTKLSSGALNGRFNGFKGNEVLTALEEDDQRLRASVMSTLFSSGAFAGKVKATDFKRAYIAHTVFGDGGEGAFAGALAIATNKGFDENQGVKFLNRLCSLNSWKAAVMEAGAVKNFDMLLAKLQLEDFVSEDHEAGFPDYHTPAMAEDVATPDNTTDTAPAYNLFDIINGMVEDADSKTKEKLKRYLGYLKNGKKLMESELSDVVVAYIAQDDFDLADKDTDPVVAFIRSQANQTEAPQEKPFEANPALLDALTSIHERNSNLYNATSQLEDLYEFILTDIKAGKIKDETRIEREYVYALEKLNLNTKEKRLALLSEFEALIAEARKAYGELSDTSRAHKALETIIANINLAIHNSEITDSEEVVARFTKATQDNRWLKAAADKVKAANPAPVVSSEEEKATVKLNTEAAVSFISSHFKPEERIALIKEMPLDHFLMFSDYSSNRDAEKRAHAAKAPTMGNKKGVNPHLVGKLSAPQQKLVKLLYITKEHCPKVWAAVEAHCEKAGIPCSLPWMIGDAHSRKYAWQIADEDGVEGWKLERPDTVDVMVFSQGVDGKPLTDSTVFGFVDAECSKFTAFTNAEANEVSLIESKLEAKSVFVKTQWQDASQIYAPGSSLKDIRSKFAAELMLLDNLDLKNSYKPEDFDKPARARTSAGIKAAFLETADMCRDAGKSFAVAFNAFWVDFFSIFTGKEEKIKEVCDLVEWIEDSEHKNRKTGKLVDSWSGTFNDAVKLEAVYHFGEWLKKQK